ncbi:MAG TPA: 3-hydroxyacyl-CoA dehydrogenase family protein [Gemmatimonadales bacterium]|nr:3-hydroxyacyl-CoA dehydrogenase family protein [Gemmatimonadales bacterium]
MTPPRVAVVGAGTMGHGIAYVAALAGCAVALTDSRAAALEEARSRIEGLLDGAVRRGRLAPAERSAAAGRLRAEPDLAGAVGDADIVVEAIVEDLEAKRRLFRDLEPLAPGAAVLATNTSSLSVGEIARGAMVPERVLGLHFFNPVHAMKLVEVVPHESTDRAAVDQAVAFARLLGKEPIVVRDSPGFASSRLGVVLGLEAMRMLEEGVASAEDIDKAMELGYGHPMGPLKVADLVGLDVRLAIAEYLHQRLESPHYAPPQVLRDKVARGELGKKTGKGFYRWND